WAARTRLPRLILIRGNACGLPGAHSTRGMHQVAGGFSIDTAQQPRPIGNGRAGAVLRDLRNTNPIPRSFYSNLAKLHQRSVPSTRTPSWGPNRNGRKPLRFH